MCHQCYIIPKDVLERLSNDNKEDSATRDALTRTIATDNVLRSIRALHAKAVQVAPLLGVAATVSLAAAPSILVYDCKHTTSLPGAPVGSPGTSTDITAKRCFATTQDVADFYQQCFGRNSIDAKGGSLLSSIHYDVNYANAFWDGSQMTYGDGDGALFIDFTASDDVVGHELTHGVTQHTAGFTYTNEPGGLNESMSDVFGSMFRQWRAKQTVTAADWLIGPGILGPKAKARGFTCLRDMANPSAKHAMAPQPMHYKNYQPGGDPHHNSGIPNHAFYQAAMKLGGKSWEKLGKVWYEALTGGKAKKTTKMAGFAKLTRAAAKSLFPTDPKVYAAVDYGWTAVGL